MRLFRGAVAVIMLGCLAPFISMGAADVIARIYGCTLDLASVKPCMIGGVDRGHMLMTLGMMGWFLFTTLPVLAAVTALWLVVEIARWLVQRRRVA